MDKYSGYVAIVYIVTLALLVGYLVWMWLRLNKLKDVPNISLEQPLNTLANSQANNQATNQAMANAKEQP